MSSRLLLVARIVVAGIGIAYAATAVHTMTRVYSGPEFTRSFTLPGHAAEAALLAMIAIFILTGATVHVAAFVPALLTIIAFMIAKQESESSLAPAVGLSTGLIAAIYARAGLGAIRALTAPRRATLLVSVALAVIAIILLQDTPEVLDWQRIRTKSGDVELRRSVFRGRCRTIVGAKDKDEIDSGCVRVVRGAQARNVIAFGGGAAVLGLVGVVGAPRLRRLSDGVLVPPWI